LVPIDPENYEEYHSEIDHLFGLWGNDWLTLEASKPVTLPTVCRKWGFGGKENLGLFLRPFSMPLYKLVHKQAFTAMFDSRELLRLCGLGGDSARGAVLAQDAWSIHW